MVCMVLSVRFAVALYCPMRGYGDGEVLGQFRSGPVAGEIRVFAGRITFPSMTGAADCACNRAGGGNSLNMLTTGAWANPRMDTMGT